MVSPRGCPAELAAELRGARIVRNAAGELDLGFGDEGLALDCLSPRGRRTLTRSLAQGVPVPRALAAALVRTPARRIAEAAFPEVSKW